LLTLIADRCLLIATSGTDAGTVADADADAGTMAW
jgi:hypothetical protein